MSHFRANELLGYPPDARLLIVNADDLGVYHAVNAAILRTITDGVVRSIDGWWPKRAADLRFLVSREARETVAAEGIILLDYRPLQAIWSRDRASSGIAHRAGRCGSPPRPAW